MDEHRNPHQPLSNNQEENIVEEKNKNGTVINKYLKGRLLGKVPNITLREDSLNDTNSQKFSQVENTQPK